jgi:hypothetical protein
MATKKTKTPAAKTPTTDQAEAPTATKKTKTEAPAASRLTATKTEAPMVVTREQIEIEISREDIAQLAYARFVARGYVHGHAREDWLSAEAELRAARQ